MTEVSQWIDADLLKHYGVDSGWTFGMTRRVEWSDVDAFSHVNHVVYIRWCEEIRNAYLEQLGLPKITASTAGVVIKDIYFDYRKPLSFQDRVFVTARTQSLRRTSFRMEYAVWKDGLVGRGEATCVLMISNTGERVQIPDFLKTAMIQRDRTVVETLP